MGFTLNQLEQERQIRKLQKKEDKDTSDYEKLSNLPKINNVELKGDKTTGDLGLQDELTFDNAPIDGSNNPVKSDGIYDSEKDIYAVMGQMGAKNLIPYPYFEADTKTHREVTYTVNSDNTITLSGTANGGASNYILLPSSQNIKYPAGTYILSGCPAGGSRTTYWMQLSHDGVVDTFDVGESATITLATEQVVGIGIYVAAGVNVTGKVYNPMLRLASDTDGTYQPYAKTNKQLTDDITGITPHLLPDAPTTDGSYKLKVTVTSGEAAYSWEAVTP